MQRKLHRKIRVQGVKCGGARRVVDGIEPNTFGQRRMDHRRIESLIERSKPRSKCANTLRGVHIHLEKFNCKSVARLRSLDIKGSAQRVVAFYEGERVARLLNRIAKRVHRVRFKNVSGS